jgi:hypothetical protein
MVSSKADLVNSLCGQFERSLLVHERQLPQMPRRTARRTNGREARPADTAGRHVDRVPLARPRLGFGGSAPTPALVTARGSPRWRSSSAGRRFQCALRARGEFDRYGFHTSLNRSTNARRTLGGSPLLTPVTGRSRLVASDTRSVSRGRSADGSPSPSVHSVAAYVVVARTRNA